ncbi:hypothetical protein NQ317_011165 [Molorchus minor]|uniref:Uncharacterized protein n=1 Tax=Molorchus minor TaxID=1323400 RepID=A0ABQ9IVF8_9CUCU|nr:hypothetical protein NQ317_011165 [Molorchus minor]
MIDHEAIRLLVGYVEDCLRGGNTIEEVGLHPATAGDRGLKLLVMLSVVFPSHFHYADVLEQLMGLLRLEDENIACMNNFQDLMDTLAPICKELAQTGTPKQS